jgi:uncharacterized UBP type Zn finger protein
MEEEREEAQVSCEHLSQAKDVQPTTPDGCEECLAIGDDWVQLRMCKICGHVGCCDSSKNKHATGHFHETGHPIMQAYNSGQDWMWCYIDEAIVR